MTHERGMEKDRTKPEIMSEQSDHLETILVVDDEEFLRELTAMVLCREGYLVVEAADGRQALELAGRHPGTIHLLIVDVIMPLMGGVALAEQLQRTRADLHVLYVSGYPCDALIERGVLTGEVAFLQKPFPMAILTQKVRDILDAASQSKL